MIHTDTQTPKAPPKSRRRSPERERIVTVWLPLDLIADLDAKVEEEQRKAPFGIRITRHSLIQRLIHDYATRAATLRFVDGQP